MKLRNSLFGFNKEDVLSCISSLMENENHLSERVSALEKELESIESENVSLKAANTSLSERLSKSDAELAERRQREDYLNRLSESIGKLYLVAETNANSIMESARESADASEEIVRINLETADTAKKAFDEITAELLAKTVSYNETVDSLKARLDEVKSDIIQNTLTISDADKNFNSVSESIKAEAGR